MTSHSDLPPARLRALADEWRMLDLQASMTETEMARYEKLPLLMATALENVAQRVIELEAERDALRLAGKHLAIKLAELYRMGNVSPTECQAMRDWMALMPARAALEDRT